MPSSEADRQLVARIRAGDQDAWQECINAYEGRLLAFVNSRLRNRAASEDVVQEAFMGFLISLPNYDERTPIETYLFSITAYKLTDHMRREGRRPTIPLISTESRPGPENVQGRARAASSLMQSVERKGGEEDVVFACLQELVERWKAKGEYERLKCIELIFSLGWPNKVVAKRLGITEQAVANHKYYAVSKLKEAATQARLQDFTLSIPGD